MPFSLDINNKESDKPKLSLAKKHPVLFPLFIFITLVFAYYLLAGEADSPKIGVVSIDGIIVESETIVQKIQLLGEDPMVRGVIVRINSPGGAAAPSQEIFAELTSLRKKKKVYASISSTAASGGYYIAIGTEKIFANPASLIGSIGTIMHSFNLEKLMDKLGVRMEVITSGKHKDMGSMFRPMKNEERDLLQAALKDAHRQFILDIADNRLLTVKETEPLADGRIFTGSQALKLKLIDGLAGLSQVAEKMRQELGIEKQVELFYPPDKKNSWRSLLDMSNLWPLKQKLLHSELLYLSQ